MTGPPCCDGIRDAALLHSRDCPAETERLRKLHDELERYARHGFLRDAHGRPIP